MLIKKTTEKENFGPLLDIIRKEYGLKNIFFVIFSICSIGLSRTLHFNEIIENKNIFYVLNVFFCFIFAIGVYPFVKKLIKEIGFIIWPSFNEIIIKIINVIFFVIILICMIFCFKYLYSIIDPIVRSQQ
ncbi:MAG: hypothetical protein Q2306_01980 [Phytoplasma sp.]|uniref:hypothetical protein n=1 Tax=Phytoplasma sp. TaxID=2155 RepID=UPI002B4066CC|nr:hypothetical protein [Phytoplasma sp.]WRH06649.1 MAG: hypothetical protein Q2306_01980 [Phytoplasma sp.]